MDTAGRYERLLFSRHSMPETSRYKAFLRKLKLPE